jgi:hypothetical protein
VSAIRVSGPYIDVKGSQAKPYKVTLLDPGRRVEVHRFPTPEAAREFAERVRELAVS